MPFSPRTFGQIVNDSINFAKDNTNLTDFNVGSVIRTLIEAVGLENDEEYFQMVQLLREFAWTTATREGVIRRASDFDLIPLTATPSSGYVIFMDDGLLRTYLTTSIFSGDALISVQDASVFSGIVTPFTLRLSESKTNEEEVSVTAINIITNTLTLSAGVLNNHLGLDDPSLSSFADEVYLDAARASYVSGDPDIALNAGVLVSAPAVGELPEVRFLTTTVSSIKNGNYKSDLIKIRANRTGRSTNVGSRRIIRFPVTKPFSTALVINLLDIGGGTDDETISKFVDRIQRTINSLSRGTVNAVISFLQQVTLPTTGQRIAKVSVYESFVSDPDLPGDGEFIAYVDDGSGSFIAEIFLTGRGNVSSAGTLAAGSLILDFVQTEGEFTDSGHIIVDINNSHVEILEYVSISSGTFNLLAATTQDHDFAEAIIQVELVDDNTDERRVFYRVKNTAVIRSSFRLFLFEDGVLRELVMYEPRVSTLAASDYLFNEGVGQIEFLDHAIPIAGSQLYALYDRYDGILNRAQRTLDGDVQNPTEFPGVRSVGIKGLVLPSEQLVINVSLGLDILEGFNRDEVRERADRITRNYINSLNDGEEFIIAELIERVMGIAGMNDLTVSLPANNVTVPHGFVAVPGTITIA